MKRVLVTTLLLCGMALGQNAAGGGGGTARKLQQNAGAPACTVAGQVVYDTVADVTKICNNALVPVTIAGGTLTNAANSLPAKQIVVGNTYPDTLTTNCTIGSVVTDAAQCPGGFYGASQAADATPVVGEAIKWSGGKWVLATTTDVSDPSLQVAQLIPDATHVYPMGPGQISLVAHDAVTEGHYILLSAATNGQFTDSATCTAGQRYLGTWAATAAAGTRLANISPGICSSAVTATYSKTIVVGAENGAVLLDADLGPQRAQFQIPLASTITEVDVKADGGTPNVIVAKRVCTVAPCVTGANETVTNLLTGALATAASGGTACAKTGATTGIDGFTTCGATLQNNTSFPAGGYVELVSGTAGGTAKRMSITVTWTTP